MPHQILPEFSQGAPGGVCFVCKSSRRTGDCVVDFFVDPDDLGWHAATNLPGMSFELAAGNLEICSSCIVEVAHALGMKTTEQVNLMQEALDHTQSAWAVAVDRADAAEAALARMEHWETTKAIAERVFGPEPK